MTWQYFDKFHFSLYNTVLCVMLINKLGQINENVIFVNKEINSPNLGANNTNTGNLSLLQIVSQNYKNTGTYKRRPLSIARSTGIR